MGDGGETGGAPSLEPLGSPAPAPLEFELEGPYDGPADDYQPGGEAYKVHARRGQEEVGHIEITIIPDGQELFVNWVEVAEGIRRQGIATALCAEALRLWPGYSLGTSGLTDLGAEFWPSLEEGKEVTPEL